MQNKAPFIGIVRHRLGRDGEGVTTLAAFHGCPLRCKYCLNPQCQREDVIREYLTPQELLQKVVIDDLYFQATGGGITFGGGEPAKHSRFIEEFRSISNPVWKINIETSLNVAREHIERIAPFVHQFIIDIKDMNSDIYKAYTGVDNTQVRDNLEYLSQAGLSFRCHIRIPLIPNFNTQADTEYSKRILMQMGYTDFDEFEYQV